MTGNSCGPSPEASSVPVKPGCTSRGWSILRSTLFCLGAGWMLLAAAPSLAQPPQCQPDKVQSAEACAKCHGSEVAVWRQTPHSRTFDELARNPKAREITQKLGVLSVKRNETCIQCHFTTQTQADGSIQPIAGISCESCHGASRDWLTVHNDYGGVGVTHESESPSHRAERLAKSAELGMRNTQNVYQIARSCLNCHTVPQEKLVNVGGHPAGSADFELVAWSQGLVRHNFVRSAGLRNAEPTRERLRVMYIAGLIADLEYSTRATARATVRSDYGVTVAERAGKVALRLLEIQTVLQDPILQQALESFAEAELRTGNAARLEAIADAVGSAGSAFALEHDGSRLAAVDPFLPDPATYRR